MIFVKGDKVKIKGLDGVFYINKLYDEFCEVQDINNTKIKYTYLYDILQLCNTFEYIKVGDTVQVDYGSNHGQTYELSVQRAQSMKFFTVKFRNDIIYFDYTGHILPHHNKYSNWRVLRILTRQKTMTLDKAYEQVMLIAIQLKKYCSVVQITQIKFEKPLEQYLYRDDRISQQKWCIIHFHSYNLNKMLEAEKVLEQMGIHLDISYCNKTVTWQIDWSFHIGEYKSTIEYILEQYKQIGQIDLQFGRPIRLKQKQKYNNLLKMLELYVFNKNKSKSLN